MNSLLSDAPDEAAPEAFGWLKAAGVGLLAVAWAVGAHIASVQEGPSDWGAALALAPVVMAVSLALWSLPSRWLGGVVALGLAAVLVIAWSWLSTRVALLFFIEQTGIYLMLAVVFGRTLWDADESLVTQMARRVHGGVLTPKVEAYTRKVTWAWSLFFLTLAVGSAALFLLAPRAVWSTFANLLGGPLIGLMFVGEFACRYIALPGEPKTSFSDAIRAWKAHQARKAP